MSRQTPDAGPRVGRTNPISVRIPEACRLTGIGRSKLYELIADGTIDVVKVGAITLVPFESLLRLIDKARQVDGI